MKSKTEVKAMTKTERTQRTRMQTAAVVLAALMALAVLMSSLLGAVTMQTAAEKPLYTVTYERVGGTDEYPIYQYGFTWHGDEPLVIDSNGWHIGENE
ncbi:MAG: hypothetical protein IJA67_10510 [Oscillospiraceae bacterium]|nr:hypothetical protein [Oscillospiraceae bacterium]